MRLRDDERFLDHPAAELADRLEILQHKPEPVTVAATLHVIAEWLDDVENDLTVIVKNPSQGEPDWYPRPVSVSWLRRDLHREAAQRT